MTKIDELFWVAFVVGGCILINLRKCHCREFTIPFSKILHFLKNLHSTKLQLVLLNHNLNRCHFHAHNIAKILLVKSFFLLFCPFFYGFNLRKRRFFFWWFIAIIGIATKNLLDKNWWIVLSCVCCGGCILINLRKCHCREFTIPFSKILHFLKNPHSTKLQLVHLNHNLNRCHFHAHNIAKILLVKSFFLLFCPFFYGFNLRKRRVFLMIYSYHRNCHEELAWQKLMNFFELRLFWWLHTYQSSKVSL